MPVNTDDDHSIEARLDRVEAQADRLEEMITAIQNQLAADPDARS
jgi:hypothetical protein